MKKTGAPPPKKTDTNVSKEIQFTLDSEKTGVLEMPSITRLLNRKSLKSSSSSKTAEKKPEKNAEDIKSTSQPLQLQTKQARRRSNSTPKLLVWNRSDLASSADPMAQALSQLLEKGLQSAVFLAAPPEEDTPSTIPELKASACLQPGAKSAIWRGLKWNPAMLPHLWRQLSTVGFIELPPPETATVATSDRNVSRTAFGVDSTEWLSLALIGPAHECRGILAMVSLQSLLGEIQSRLILLSSAVPKDKIIPSAA